jgi:hypothetical protein
MTALNQSKPRFLSAQIKEAEQQILKHQAGVSIRTANLFRKIYQQLTAPATLVLAGSIGFIFGEITKGSISNIRSTADKQSVAKTSPLRIALKLLASAHTLYTALPLAWIIKSFQNHDMSGQVPQRQSPPLMSSNKPDSRHRSK